MAGGGSSSSKSTPVDMTPEAFKGLQGPYASILGSLLGFQITGPDGTTQSPVQFGYPGGQFIGDNGQTTNQANAASTSAGQTTRQRWGGQSPNSASGGGWRNTPYRAPSTQQSNPYAGFTLTNPNLGTGNPNDILNNIPGYQGPLTAALGANEQSLLDQLMQGSGAGSGTGTAGGLDADTMAFLQSQMAGNFLPGNMTPQRLSEFAQGYQGAYATPGYDPNSENPFLQAAIQAAQRPTLQGLEETLSRTLPGRFTQAGQFNQPQGSSAFDRAAAIATRGAGDTMGDIATNLSYQQMNDQLQRAFQAQQSARGQEDAALQAELARSQESSQAAQDRQIQAAGLAPQVSTTQVNNMVSNLQAQALPRLIQEYGIERGMDEFNNRVNSLLSVIGIAGGVTQPTISTESKSKSSTKPNLLPIL